MITSAAFWECHRGNGKPLLADHDMLWQMEGLHRDVKGSSEGTFASRWGKHLQGVPADAGGAANVTLPRVVVARPQQEMMEVTQIFL